MGPHTKHQLPSYLPQILEVYKRVGVGGQTDTPCLGLGMWRGMVTSLKWSERSNVPKKLIGGGGLFLGCVGSSRCLACSSALHPVFAVDTGHVRLTSRFEQVWEAVIGKARRSSSVSFILSAVCVDCSDLVRTSLWLFCLFSVLVFSPRSWSLRHLSVCLRHVSPVCIVTPSPVFKACLSRMHCDLLPCV